MMQMPAQHQEHYRGHEIRVSAAALAHAPGRFGPCIDWVERTSGGAPAFYKLRDDDTSFVEPAAAIAHGVALVRRWVDRMLAAA